MSDDTWSMGPLVYNYPGVSTCTPLYLYLVAWPSLYVPFFLCDTVIASSFSFILVFQFFDSSLPISVQSWKKNLKISTQTPVKMNWIHWFRLRLSKTRSCLGVAFTTFLHQKIFVTLLRVLFHPRSLKERPLQSMRAVNSFRTSFFFSIYFVFCCYGWKFVNYHFWIYLSERHRKMFVCVMRLLRLISLLQSWYYPHICGALTVIRGGLISSQWCP